MGRRSLDPWLVSFLWGEIEAVISWRRSIDQGIKPDPDSRFSDDGSNFRNLISSPPPGQTLLVQLHEVLSIEPDVIVVLSDGITRTKARLSDDAVATLAVETRDNKFDFTVTGDIIQLKRFTVITTPFGPSEGFVQLAIEEIEWESLSRKSIGEPRPIEEEDEIRALLDDIVRLRCPQSDFTQTLEDGEVQGQSPIQARATGPFQQNQEQDPPIIQATQSSIPAPTSGSQFLQTQAPPRRRLHGPTLANDGFEIESGVNLHRPLQPGSPNLLRHNNVSQSGGQQTDTSTKLLELLGRKRPREEDPDEQSSSSGRRAAIISETPLKSPNPQRPPDSSFSRIDRPSLHSADSVFRSVPTLSNKSPTSAQPPPKEPESPLQSKSLLQSKSPLQSSGKSSIPYKRRKIPSNQKKLLDKPESWLPSLPGYRFPTPNVPIELFNKWRRAIATTPSPRKSLQQNSAPVQSQAVSSPDSADEQIPWSDSDIARPSTSSEEDAEPFSASQWPPTQPQRKPYLPPDSSMGSAVHGTQQDDLEIDVPRAMPIRKTPARLPHSGTAFPSKPATSPLAQSSSRVSDYLPLGTSSANIRTQDESTHINRAPSSQRAPSIRDEEGRSISPKRPKTPQHRIVQGTVNNANQTAQDSPQLPRAAGQKGPRKAASSSTSEPSDALLPAHTAPGAIRGEEEQNRIHDSSPPRILPSLGTASRSLFSTQADHRFSNGLPEMHSSPTFSSRQLDSPFRNPPMVGRSMVWQSPLPSNAVRAMKGASDNGTPDASRTYPRTTDHHRPEDKHHRSPELRARQRASDNPGAQPRSSDLVDESSRPHPPEHPDERHRRVRREYLSKNKNRKHWLLEHYHFIEDGTLRFQDVLRAYRASHPDDDCIEAREFGQVVSQAFPLVHRPPLAMLFQIRTQDSKAQPNGTQQHPLQVEREDGNVQEIETSRPGPTNATDTTQETQETEMANESSNVFREFCCNWLNVKPGGPFAVKVQDKRRSRRRVDVLKWEL